MSYKFTNIYSIEIDVDSSYVYDMSTYWELDPNRGDAKVYGTLEVESI